MKSRKGRFALKTFKSKLTRDSVLFLVGILGIGYETLLSNSDRPTLLVLFGAMVGLPAFLRTDEKQNETTPVKEKAEAEAEKQQEVDDR